MSGPRRQTQGIGGSRGHLFGSESPWGKAVASLQGSCLVCHIDHFDDVFWFATPRLTFYMRCVRIDGFRSRTSPDFGMRNRKAPELWRAQLRRPSSRLWLCEHSSLATWIFYSIATLVRQGYSLRAVSMATRSPASRGSTNRR